MPTCDCCGCVCHPDQAEPSAIVTIDRGGPRCTYRVCGSCVERIEAMLNRGRRPATIPIDRPLLTVSR